MLYILEASVYTRAHMCIIWVRVCAIRCVVAIGCSEILKEGDSLVLAYVGAHRPADCKLNKKWKLSEIALPLWERAWLYIFFESGNI